MKITPCILIAFEHATTQKAVMQQVKEDTYLVNFNQLSNYLFFSTIENATKERANSRQSIHSKIVDIWI